MSTWPVIPICDKQLQDVSSKDIILGGLYRICDTYKGGGGYDKFVSIYKETFGIDIDSRQFVVQVKGCPLRCNYCYVTDRGIHGKPVYVEEDDIIRTYRQTGVDTLHLMGGAPARYLPAWRHIGERAQVFHSDFLLVEGYYQPSWIADLPGLHAVSIKEPYIYEQAGMYTELHKDTMWKNLENLLKYRVWFYITFTGEPELRDEIRKRFGNTILEQSFTIPINYGYKALGGT